MKLSSALSRVCSGFFRDNHGRCMLGVAPLWLLLSGAATLCAQPTFELPGGMVGAPAATWSPGNSPFSGWGGGSDIGLTGGQLDEHMEGASRVYLEGSFEEPLMTLRYGAAPTQTGQDVWVTHTQRVDSLVRLRMDYSGSAYDAIPAGIWGEHYRKLSTVAEFAVSSRWLVTTFARHQRTRLGAHEGFVSGTSQDIYRAQTRFPSAGLDRRTSTVGGAVSYVMREDTRLTVDATWDGWRQRYTENRQPGWSALPDSIAKGDLGNLAAVHHDEYSLNAAIAHGDNQLKLGYTQDGAGGIYVLMIRRAFPRWGIAAIPGVSFHPLGTSFIGTFSWDVAATRWRLTADRAEANRPLLFEPGSRASRVAWFERAIAPAPAWIDEHVSLMWTSDYRRETDLSSTERVRLGLHMAYSRAGSVADWSFDVETREVILGRDVASAWQTWGATAWMEAGPWMDHSTTGMVFRTQIGAETHPNQSLRMAALSLTLGFQRRFFDEMNVRATLKAQGWYGTYQWQYFGPADLLLPHALDRSSGGLNAVWRLESEIRAATLFLAVENITAAAHHRVRTDWIDGYFTLSPRWRWGVIWPMRG